MEGVDRSRRVAAVFLGTGAIACVLAFVPGARQLQYEQFALAKELLFPIVTLLLAAWLVWSTRRVALSALEVVSLLGVMLALVSTFAAETTAALSYRGFAVIVASSAAFCVARAVRDSEGLVTVLALAVLVGAVTAVAEMYGVLPALSMPGRAPGGTEGNRNFMAHALVVGLPALLVVYVRDDRPWLRRIGLAGVCLVIIAVVASRSRAAWLGLGVLAIGAGVVWWSSGLLRTHRRGFALLAAGIAVSAAVAVLVPNRLAWTDERPYWSTLSSLADHEHGTGRGRAIQYRNTLSLVATAPLLGVGAGNWSRAYPEHATPGDPSYRPQALQPVNRLPNSDWLGMAAERGIPAALLHASLLALLAWGAWRARKDDAVLAGALLAAVASVSVMGIFDAVLLRPTPALLAFAWFGAAAPAFRPLVTLRLSRLVVIPLVVAAGLFAFDGTRRLSAHVLGRSHDIAGLEAALRVDPTAYQLRTTLAYRLYETGKCDEALEHAAQALRDYPHATVHAIIESCRRHERPERP